MSNLPVPTDDGAYDHLTSLALPPHLSLPSTSAKDVTFSQLPGLTIFFIYPRTGAPNESIPASWDAIPGARGCTPQACGFRDNYPALLKKGVSQVFGISTQDTQYQKEAKERLGLPYELLSDEEGRFGVALKLPEFEWEGKRLLKRACLAVENGKVVKWWYPIFPSGENVNMVLKWLEEGNH